MKIYAFSIDMKLDAEGQGYKILEVNDGLCSGFNGYSYATETEMLSEVMVPQYRELFPDYEVVSLVDPVVKNPDKPFIMIPRSDQLVLRYTRAQLVQNSCTNLIHLNSDLRFINFCDNKAFQSEIFASDDRLKDIYPDTRIITTYDKDMADNNEWLSARTGKVVLKPSRDYGGNGVTIVDGPNASSGVFNILKERKYKNNKEPWCGLRGLTAVVQELVPPSLIDIEDEQHDATMRVVITVWQENDAAPFQCKIHDAYWKPSAMPYQGIDNRASRISYSASFREPYKRPHIIDRFKEHFRLEMRGDFNMIAANSVVGVEVDPEIKLWLFPMLSDSMPLLIEQAVSKPVSERVLEWIGSDRKELRALGASIAFQGDYYPESDINDGRDIIRLNYPPHMLDGLKDYIVKHHGTDTLAYNTITDWLSSDDLMACEDEKEALKAPLRDTVAFAMQARILNSVESFLLHSLKI